MSQVRKLQTGSTVPKRGKLTIGTKTYDLNDEKVWEALNTYLQNGKQYGLYTKDLVNALSSGQDITGDVLDNRVYGLDGFTALSDRENGKLKKAHGSTWDAITNNGPQQARDAIAYFLGFNYATPQDQAKNRTISNKAANFDYDTIDGKSVFSANPKNIWIQNRFDEYLDWLSDPNWDDSKVTWEGSRNEPILRAWYGQYNDRAKAREAIDAAINEAKSKPWDEVSEQSKELLAYFNVGTESGSRQSAPSGSSGSVVGQRPVTASGDIDTTARTDTGAFRTWTGNADNGEISGKLYTNSTEGNGRPYLLNKDRLGKYGLGDDYLNGVVYNGRIFRPNEVGEDVALNDIMQNVTTINNSALNPAELYDNLNRIINYTDYNPANYTYYNPEEHYWNNSAIRAELGDTGRYGIADATNAYDGLNGGHIYEIYDFGQNGNEQWGFRSPFYLITDENGNLKSVNGNNRYSAIPEEYAFLNRNYGSGPQFSNWIQDRDNKYGLNRSVWGSDAHNTNPYDIYEGKDGKFYHKKGNGEFVVLDDDLVDAIFNKELKPSRRQMDNGTLSGKSKKNTFDRNAPLAPPPFQHGPVSRKEGGKVQLKPLPAKYQMGSRLLVEGPSPIQQSVESESPLVNSGNLWESLTSADRKEITAAAVDVAGAIAGLIPGGSIAGAASGIGVSTPLFLSAAKERKGHLDAGDWGQAALATGLDLVSLIPYLGETGKLVKVGKAISKVAVPLGKAFGALGLVEAATALAKNPKDWDTNDLLKLSAGIQSVINMGHNAYISRGDSKLAAEISRIRGGAKPAEISYTSSKKYTIGDTKTTLDPLEAGEIDSVLSSKTPGKALQDILKKRGVKEEEIGNAADLLREWGFQVDQKGKLTRLFDRKGEGLKVGAQKVEKEPEFKENGWLADPFRIVGNPELKRRAFIDKYLPEMQNDPRIQRLIFDNGKVVSTTRTPREVITESERTLKTGFNEGAAARAYLQSLARTGSDKITTSWVNPIKQNGDNGTITTVERRPTPEFIADEAALRLKRESPSDMVRSMRNDVQGVGEEGIARAVSRVVPTAEVQSLGRVENLGANGMTNKDLIAHLNDKSIPYSEALDLLESLPERKLVSLLKAIEAKGTGARAKQIRSKFLKSHSQLEDAIKSLDIPGTTSRAFAVSSANADNARKAFAESRRVASNIEALRKSNDPMKTLRQLSEQDDFKNMANDNATLFREALNESLRESAYKRMVGQRLDRYLFKLQSQMKDRGLIFKKGGILKAQTGLGLPEFKLQEFKPMQFGNSYTGFNPNTNQVFSQWNTTKNAGPLFNINVGTTASTGTSSSVASAASTPSVSGDGLGGPSKNAKNYFKYLDTGLGLYDYISTLRSDKKYTDQMIKALNAGRVSRTVTPFNHIAEVTPEVDRAMQDVRARTMMGIKPVTSDIIAHNALVNQLQGQAFTQLGTLMGQKSQQMASLKAQNQQIDNANTERFDQVANENRIANASIDSAIEQQKAAEIMRRGQSRSNYIKELRSILAKDSNTILQQSYNDKLKSEQLAYERGLDNMVGDPSIRERWNNLGSAGQANYTDYTDFLQKEYGDRFTSGNWGTEIDRLNKQMSDNMLQWRYDNTLNFNYPGWLLGRQYLAGRSYKKGGTVRGNTRYKLEPDEQIWVNQNKAVHDAVAKLNDNTIKLLLRALK